MLSKKKETFRKLVIFTISMGLCLSVIQLGAMSTTNMSSVSDHKTPSCIFKKIDNFAPQRITKNLAPGSSDKVGLLGTDVLIYGSLDEGIICQNPTITTDVAQKVLIGFEVWPNSFTPPDPYFRYSNDDGKTWLPEDGVTGWSLTEQDYDSILPKIDFAGDKGGFGAVLPFGQNNWMTFNFPDISDPEAGDGWTANGWLADVMMEEWHSCDVCGVNSEFAPSVDAFGLAIWTGDTVDGGDNGLWYGWETSEGSEFVVYPDESDPGYDFEADQAVNDVDLSTGMYYQAFYRYDDVGADPLPDGVFLRGVQLDGTDQWVESWTISYHIPNNVQHPDIKADGGNCYLVYETWYGIECLYSNDNGNTFQTSEVAQNGKYPSVTSIGEYVVVSYMRDGDLYTALSDDSGATWIEKPPVNDVSGSVVEQDHGADVSSRHIVWSDNREDDKYLGIYYDQASFPLPIIGIKEISGGFGVKVDIENTGTADATDVQWSIDLEGGLVLLGKHAEGTISTLAVGSSETVKIPFVLGLGKSTLKVTAGSATQEKDCTIILFFVTGL